jgi:hypothetical protein
MPILKAPKKRHPPWKEWDRKAQKEGIRAPVYAVNGDVYTGEWVDNKKHGEFSVCRLFMLGLTSE